MATARELIFFVRAENQASKTIKTVGKDFGSLAKLRSAQAGAMDAANAKNVASLRKVAQVQQTISRNQATYNKMLAQSSMLNRRVSAGVPVRGFNMDETILMAKAANQQVATLAKQELLLADDLDAARLAAAAQAAEMDRLRASLPIERMQQLITVSQRVGRAMQLTGAVTLAAFAASAHAAAQFNSQLTLAATQARAPGASSATVAGKSTQLQNVVLEQMQKFPASSQDMADALYQIFSSTNISSISKAAGLLQTFNQMAVAGGTDLKTMTDAGISLYNNFPHEFKTMTDAANAFFAAVRYARTTPAQFAASLTSVLPVAKAAGLQFRDVADAMALITRQTGGAATGRDSTGLARLMEMLSNPNVMKGLSMSGINVETATGKMKPLLDIITQIYDTFVKTGKLKPGPDTLNFFKMISAAGSGGAGTAGTIQGRRVFDQLITNIKAYHTVSKQVNNDNDEMAKSFLAMSKTPGVTWSVFVNQLHAAVIEIGTQAIPALIDLGKPIASAVKWFNSLSDSTKHQIAIIGTYGGAILLLVGTLGVFLGALSKIGLAFKLFMGEKGLGVLATEAGAASPVLLAFIAVLTTLGIILATKPQLITKMVNALGGFKTIITIITGLMAAMTFNRILSGFSSIGSEAVGARGEVDLLRSSLGKLSLIAAIAIPIVIHYSTEYDKDPRSKKGALSNALNKATNIINKVPGGFIVSDVAKAGAQAGRDTADALGLSDKARAAAAKASAAKGLANFTTSFSHSKDLQAILASPLVPTILKSQAQAAYVAGDFATVSRILKMTKLPSTISGTIPAQKAKIIASASAATQNAAYIANLKTVSALQTAYNKTGSLGDYKKFQDALNSLNSKYNTALYKGYTNDYLSRIVSADKKATTAMASAQKKALAVRVKAEKAAAAQLGNAYTNTMTLYNNLLQQNQTNFGTLFNGPFMQNPLQQNLMAFNGGTSVSGGSLLKDLKSQMSQFTQFNRAVSNLSKKGAPSSLTDQLNQMGPAALPDIRALNKLSKPALAQYVATWNAGQKAIKANTMKQLQSQIALYKKFGANVALAIISGVKSQDVKLQRELETLINKMFPNLVKKAGKAPATPARGSKSKLGPDTGHITVKGGHTIHIHNPKTESIETSTKKALFKLKTTKH